MTSSEYLLKESGPRVVAIGGGHGLAATLRSARKYASEITAVVSIADDGGSSGRLRDALGSAPPGDLRRCLVALSDPTSLWGRTFEHRFASGELEGHAFGNLLIAGLADAAGDLVVALDEIGRVLGCVGRVLPASNDPVVLTAQTPGGDVHGQVAVMRTERIAQVSVSPSTAGAPREVIAAIERADQVILGPGSLYTSVLAAAIVPGVREAIANTSALRIYVCNLAPQIPETSDYTVADHAAALSAHGIAVDQVVVSVPSRMALGHVSIAVVEFDVARPNRLAHDSEKLASVLARLT